MASERQKLANRLNARRSTGPRTNEGKALARMNALKHGLTAQKVLMPGERVEAFEALREALYDEHDPKTTTECELVELIASLSGGFAESRSLRPGFSTGETQIKSRRRKAF